ncbi:hypothetical protein [uncultured Fenollaria sp.]|uniref:hypothetical protein n=1 Tax=uncultured Fenollaria sp. TaxID=1686315 RepID=UPI0025FFC019|nr:hypothetical protein [uncultured Fenollaria sp.]
MGDIAFRDIARTIKIKAEDAANEDLDTFYYCPNDLCNARLYVCSVHGSVKPYFRATLKKYPHCENCSFSNTGSNFSISDYSENNFDFNNALISLMGLEINNQNEQRNRANNNTTTNANGTSRTVLKSLNQIYLMCKSFSPNESYAGIQIKDMLLDGRTSDHYIDKLDGTFIIEAINKSRLYDPDKLELYLTASVTNKEFDIVLNFEDTNLFWDCESKLFNNKNKVVVLAGNWTRDSINDPFRSNITSKKQIYLSRQKVVS